MSEHESIQEVAPPSQRGGSSTGYTLSPEGAARLAALQASGEVAAPAPRGTGIWAVEHPVTAEGEKLAKEIEAFRARTNKPGASPRGPDAKPFGTRPRKQPPASEKPTVKDSEGREVDLTTGEVTQTPVDEGAIVPDLAILPPTIHEDARQFAVDVEAIAQAHGIPQDKAQGIFDSLADLYTANDAELQIQTPEACVHVLATRYGPEASEKLIEDARIMANHYGADMKAYLNATGAGNSPAVIFLLAMQKRGELRYSPAEAAAKLKELRASGNFDKLSIDMGRVLSRFAQPAKTAQQPEAYAARPSSGNPISTLTHMSAKELRAELDALMKQDSDLWSSDNTKRKKAVARRQQIQAQLAQGGK